MAEALVRGLIEGSCRHPDLIVEPWVDDELVVFCAPGHPLAGRGSVDFAEIAGQPWILRERGSGTRATFDAALRRWPGGIVPQVGVVNGEGEDGADSQLATGIDIARSLIPAA